MELNQILDALYARYQEKQPEQMKYVFPPPASPEDIAAAEAALGMPLPEELRTLYARHAYMMDAWDGVSIESVQSLAEARQSLENVAFNMAADAEDEEEPNPEPFVTARGPVAALIHAPTRIPFGSDSKRELLIDLEPPAGGTPGQIIRLDIEDGTIEVIAGSLTEFFARGLEIYRNTEPGASEPGRLASHLLRLASLPVALVVTLGGILVVVAVLAWNVLSMVAESIAGLFGRKQE